jgi:hypothetical protein
MITKTVTFKLHRDIDKCFEELECCNCQRKLRKGMYPEESLVITTNVLHEDGNARHFKICVKCKPVMVRAVHEVMAMD